VKLARDSIRSEAEDRLGKGQIGTPKR
jgi:hypothetical protein